MLGLTASLAAATPPNATATNSCIIPNTRLLQLSPDAQIRTNSSSSFTCCSVRNLHSSCRTIKAMAAAEETLTVTNPPSPVSGNRQALISLSDKKDLAVLGNGLQDLGYQIVSTGGTASALSNNHKDVLVVVDSEDYPALLEFLKGDKDDQQFRRKLAWKAFQHVASYDSAVSEWLWKQTSEDKFPQSLTVPMLLKSPLRYGENPHQKAAFYVDKSLSEVNAGGIATAIQHHGKEMSYNNYLDADAAWNCVSEFQNSTCVVVKHTNPCGVASRDDILEAYRLAVKADPVSAFGGIVAFNVEVDEALAKEIREFRSPTDGETRMFYEIVVAPKYTKKGLEILRGKSKTLRILEARKNEKGKLSLRQVGGGWLAQDSDDLTPQDIQFKSVTEKAPQKSELADAEFAWLCVKHVKSNAIVIAKNNCMLGMGSGQPNRLESLRIALKKAGEEVKGAALASDAFFPFAWKDAVEEACESGVSVITEPGGSIRDGDAIDCCNKYGVSLLFTNVRHFRH
ncbi:hypothetical protein ACFX2H_013813 [Malus domestica]